MENAEKKKFLTEILRKYPPAMQTGGDIMRYFLGSEALLRRLKVVRNIPQQGVCVQIISRGLSSSERSKYPGPVTWYDNGKVQSNNAETIFQALRMRAQDYRQIFMVIVYEDMQRDPKLALIEELPDKESMLRTELVDIDHKQMNRFIRHMERSNMKAAIDKALDDNNLELAKTLTVQLKEMQA